MEDSGAGRRAVTRGQIVGPRSFTYGELDEAVARIRMGRASGPDGVPPEVARAVFLLRSGLFLSIANAALSGGRFPRQWASNGLLHGCKHYRTRKRIRRQPSYVMKVLHKKEEWDKQE